MFSKRDFKKLDKKHFDVVTQTALHIVLKSKITGHIWNIRSLGYSAKCAMTVYHKHKEIQAYHSQQGMHPKSIEAAQEMILAHDIWHKEGRNGN